jgi:hypothetical protein
MILGPALFLLFFMFMSGTVREKTGNTIATVMHWVDVNQPFSYLVVGGFAAAALLSAVLVVRWPQRPEADNPLLQYRREHPDME